MSVAGVRNRDLFGRVSGTRRVLAADTGLIVLVPAPLVSTIYVQKIHVQITTLSVGELWTFQDDIGFGLVPGVSAGAIAHFDFDFGPDGVPCTRASGFVLNITGATGAVGWITWEAFQQLAPLEDYATLVLRDGPSAYWRFNETAGSPALVDFTGRGHDSPTPPLATGYVVNGALVAGNTSMNVRGGVGKFGLMHKITMAGADYYVDSVTGADPETRLDFSPPVVAPIPDGTPIVESRGFTYSIPGVNGTGLDVTAAYQPFSTLRMFPTGGKGGTVEVWLRPRHPLVSTEFGAIIQNGVGGWGLWLQFEAALGIEVAWYDEFAGAWPRVGLTAGLLYHIVLSVDAAGIGKFYFNAILVKTFPDAADPPAQQIPVTPDLDLDTLFNVSYTGTTNGSALNATLIDELALYPYPLNAAQIAAHYRAAVPVLSYFDTVMRDGPTAYWPFDDLAGSPFLRDATGRGYDSPTPPLATGYVANGGAGTGSTSLPVRGGTGKFGQTHRITVGVSDYFVTGHSNTDPETHLDIDPTVGLVINDGIPITEYRGFTYNGTGLDTFEASQPITPLRMFPAGGAGGTIEVWLRPRGPGTALSFAPIIQDGINGWGLWLQFTVDGLQVAWYDSLAGAWPAVALTLGKRYHIVLSVDAAGKGTFYYNGTPVKTFPDPTDPPVQQFPVQNDLNLDTLFSTLYSLEHLDAYQIDNLALYPYPLTAAQVAAHYTAR